MSGFITVLHLSDLHFGMDGDEEIHPTAKAHRNNALKPLIKCLAKLPPDWRPMIVAVSGDIGWRGRLSDYDLAERFLTDLFDALQLPHDRLILCAGNHDIDRAETIAMGQPTSVSEADQWLRIENIANLARPFAAYVEFCTRFGCKPLRVAEVTHTLVGQRDLLGLRFVVLNSAWFCRDDHDKGKLWIGLPQLQVMQSHDQLADRDHIDDVPITIGLLHHPQGDLHRAEINGSGERSSSYLYLADRTHLLLSGHVHGAVEKSTRYYQAASAIVGGATYAGENYRNNFSILKIFLGSREVLRQPYEFDPRDERWNEREQETISLRRVLPGAKGTHAGSLLIDGKAFRKARAIAKLTQTELADKAKVELAIVRRAEFGTSVPRGAAQPLCSVLGIELADVEADNKDSYQFFGPGFEDPEGIRSDVWRCYKALFDVEDRARISEIKSWQRAAYDHDTDWPEVLVTLTRQRECVGFSYLSIHKPSGWCTGMYFGILKDWRGFGEARRFLNKTLRACEQLKPDLKGIIFEVARFNEADLVSALAKFNKARQAGHVQPKDLTKEEKASIRAAMRVLTYTGRTFGGGLEENDDRERVAAGAMAVVVKEGETFRFLDHIQPSIRTRLSAKGGKDEIDLEKEVCSWIMVYPRQRLLRELGAATPRAVSRKPFPCDIKEIFDFLYGEVYAGGYVGGFEGGEGHDTQIEGYGEYLEDVRSRSESLVGDQQVYLLHEEMVSKSGVELLLLFRDEIDEMGISL